MPLNPAVPHHAHQPPFAHQAGHVASATARAIQPVALLTPPQPQTAPPPKEKDVLRDTPLRYWGYLNEFGESFKDILKSQPAAAPYANGIVKHSYSAVGGYVLVDAFSKGLQGVKQAQKAGQNKKTQTFNGATASLDAALFQYAASYSLPAFVVAVTRDALKLAWNRVLDKTDKIKDILKHEIQHEIEAKGWYRFDQRALGRVKKLIDDHVLQKIKPAKALQKKISVQAEKRIALGLPLLGSLAVIPFVVHPIDAGVNWVMEHTYRPLVKKARAALLMNG